MVSHIRDEFFYNDVLLRRAILLYLFVEPLPQGRPVLLYDGIGGLQRDRGALAHQRSDKFLRIGVEYRVKHDGGGAPPFSKSSGRSALAIVLASSHSPRLVRGVK